MSYLADNIKKHMQVILQSQSEIQRANQILETAPQRVEDAEKEIAKNAQAAEILGESESVAQALYNTYPDYDFTQYGLPEPQEKPLEPEDPEASTELVPYEGEDTSEEQKQ